LDLEFRILNLFGPACQRLSVAMAGRASDFEFRISLCEAQGSIFRSISTARLSALLRVHLPPITLLR